MIALRNDYESTLNEHYENVVKAGTLIVKESSNWDLFAHDGIIWSIPHAGSGAGAGYFVSAKQLQSHIRHLKSVLGFQGAYPDHWIEVDTAYFATA